MIWNIVRNLANQRKWRRWNSAPKDLVILHTFGKAQTIPSASPFIMKVQTYLRMAEIPHKIDSKDMIGPKGKAPWISLNGKHIGDSELIIAHLNKHFNVNLNKGPYNNHQLGIAMCARVTLEEHFLWGLGMERFIYNPTEWKKVVTVSPVYDTLFVYTAATVLAKRADAQGIGRHTQEEVEELCSRDLRAVSNILGNNRYLLGDVPCQDDPAVFGIVSVVLWGLPNSPYQKLVINELPNLRDYCIRMKEQYFPDWEKCIRNPKGYQQLNEPDGAQMKAKL